MPDSPQRTPHDHEAIFVALAAPFLDWQVRFRDGDRGRRMAYITARTVMNRLDDVLGPLGWEVDHVPIERGFLTRLTIHLPDGKSITKTDGGGFAGMQERNRQTQQLETRDEDDVKSGFSDGLKRAAVLFGIGRYLYNDGVPKFVAEVYPKALEAPSEGNSAGGAPPRGRGPDPGPPPRDRPSSGNGGNGGDPRPQGGGDMPRTGRGLYAWAKEQGDRNQIDVIAYLQNWGKLQDFPGRLVEWDAGQVTLGYAEAVRKLRTARVGDPADSDPDF